MIRHTFIIAGILVEARELQFGQLAVWHPISTSAQSVVEPLCRGRGYWNRRYKNWIIHKPFAPIVLSELRFSADKHHG